MHEMSLLADLMRKLEDIARNENARAITRVSLKLGALAHISPDHLREHFEQAARGTSAENAALDIIASEDPNDPHAQEIRLDAVEVDTA